jgi:signal transduction histidine kinase
MQPLTAPLRWLAVLLSSDAIIRSVSPGSETFIGYPPQDLVDQPVTRILADDSAFEFPHMLDAAKKWGYWEGGLVHLSRAREFLEARGSLTRLAGRDNQDSAYLLISNPDMPGGVRPEPDSELGEVSARLRRFAHDLNNPLAVAMGFAQLLALNVACPPKIRADIDRVCSELKRIADTVENLRNYALLLEERSGPKRTSGEAAGCGDVNPAAALSGGSGLADP